MLVSYLKQFHLPLEELMDNPPHGMSTKWFVQTCLCICNTHAEAAYVLRAGHASGKVHVNMLLNWAVMWRMVDEVRFFCGCGADMNWRPNYFAPSSVEYAWGNLVSDRGNVIHLDMSVAVMECLIFEYDACIANFSVSTDAQLALVAKIREQREWCRETCFIFLHSAKGLLLGKDLVSILVQMLWSNQLQCKCSPREK